MLRVATAMALCQRSCRTPSWRMPEPLGKPGGMFSRRYWAATCIMSET
jgi:hypothetical protein